MSAMIFQVLKLLDDSHTPYLLARTSPMGITIIATQVGKRIEITVDEHEVVDVAMFVGDENVEVGIEAVRRALAQD